MQNMLFSLSNLAVQSSINAYGSVAVAANAAANAVEEYVYICVDSFPKAVVTFTGQNAGAGNIKRIPEILITSLIMTAAGSFAIGYGALKGGPFLLSWFTSDAEVISMGMYRLRYVTLFLGINGLLDDVVGSIREWGIYCFRLLLHYRESAASDWCISGSGAVHIPVLISCIFVFRTAGSSLLRFRQYYGSSFMEDTGMKRVFIN